MEDIYKDKSFIFWTALIVLLKIVLLGVFSSDYENQLFIPFVNHFVTFWDNPWQYVYTAGDGASLLQFPYHPLMLYIFSIGMLGIKIFSVTSVFWCNLFFKLPILIADLCIFSFLLRSFRNNRFSVLIFYFLSPIIIYAAYIHSQLDLVPVAFSFISFWYLGKKKWITGTLLLGLAICIKTNAVLFLPIFLIYLYKKVSKLKMISCLSLIILIYLIVSFPYLLSEGYRHLVLLNEKQNLFFELSISLGAVKVYVPLWVATIIYARFFSYAQINKELLNLFVILLISLFLLFVSPSTPAWFIWLVPFLSSFIIKYSKENPIIVQLYWLFNVVYLGYFLLFHIGDFGDITVLTRPLDLKIDHPFLRNCVFTTLEMVLCCIIYCIHKIATRSNAFYRKDRAVVIGIGGNSASGKTTLLNDMRQLLQEELVCLEGDGDHKWERNHEKWSHYTHLNPKANWLYKQINNIVQLKKLHPVYRKEYNHQTGKFEKEKQIQPKPFVILAGLHPFYLPKMRRIIDLKIYLDPDPQLREYWKILRDTGERGYCRKKVLSENDKRIVDSKKYIDAQKNFADLVIQYFPLTPLSPNKEKTDDQLKGLDLGINITLDSSVNIESIVNDLWNLGVKLDWDYSNDLKSQFIRIYSDLDNIDWKVILKDKIPNLDELVPYEVTFQPKQRGLVQLLILKILSEEMKDSYDRRRFN